MAGLLQFTLGLETSNFLRGIGLASSQILSLSAVADTVGKVLGGAWRQIERGGALSDLSARTGESVRDLFMLQEGFKVAGLAEGELVNMTRYLQAALAGMDGNGQKTGRVFRALGLDMERLGKERLPEQFAKVAEALGRLDKNQATAVAGKLFGREQGAAFLQIARDWQGFQSAMGAASRAAGDAERTAAAFDRIGDTLGQAKGQVAELLGRLAEELAPGIQGAIDEARIGLEALATGRFGELWGLTLQAGVQDASNLMLEKVAEWGEAWRAEQDSNGGRGSLGSRIAAGVQGVGAGTLGLLAEPFALLEEIIQPGMIRQFADREMDKALALFTEAGIEGGLIDSVTEAFMRGVEGLPNEYRQRLDALKAEIGAGLGLGSGSGGGGRGGQVDLSGLLTGGGKVRMEGSDLEKLGFVFGGGAALPLDFARDTARNTQQLVAEVKRTNELLGKGSGVATSNW